MKKTLLITLTLVALVIPSVTLAFNFDPFGGLAALDINQTNNVDNLPGFIITVVNIILALLALIAVVLIIISGFQYMFSGGDSAKMKKAQGVIGTTVLGLIVIMAAYIIANYAFTTINRVTGGDQTNVNSPQGDGNAQFCQALGGSCEPAIACNEPDGVCSDGDTGLEDCRWIGRDKYNNDDWIDKRSECSDTYGDDRCFCTIGRCCGPQ